MRPARGTRWSCNEPERLAWRRDEPIHRFALASSHVAAWCRGVGYRERETLNSAGLLNDAEIRHHQRVLARVEHVLRTRVAEKRGRGSDGPGRVRRRYRVG